MSQYYYLVATLPFLLYESEEFISSDEFLERCAQHCTASDFAVLQAVRYRPEHAETSDIALLNDWYMFERGLRNALARLRGAALNEDVEKYLRVADDGGDGTHVGRVEELARNALAESSPLRAEQALQLARWQMLDQLEAGHFFDLEKLIAYLLKLRLLERNRKFNREDGIRVFEKTYEKITDSFDEDSED